MKHLEIHERGPSCEPDIEMHLKVLAVFERDSVKYVRVQNKRDPLSAPVELPEGNIDYRDVLRNGRLNVFYLPLSLAKKVGLVE